MDVDEEESSRSTSCVALSREPRVAQLLAAVPFVVPFAQRVALFHSLVEQDRCAHQRDAHIVGTRVRISRERLFDDAFEALATLAPSQLKDRVQVTFVNEFGREEAGIDGGGVFKEFLDELTKAAFDPATSSLFCSTAAGALYPSPDVSLALRRFGGTARGRLERFEFCGRIIGKALYERVLVEPRFARFFLNKALGKYNAFDDLQSLDSVLYAQLGSLKKMDARQLDQLALTFEITALCPATGAARDVELTQGGRHLKVTAQNRSRYVQLVAHHKLNVQQAQPSQAFLRGLRAVVPNRWLKMFNPEELQILVSGTDAPIDVQDWKNNAHYGGFSNLNPQSTHISTHPSVYIYIYIL